MNPQLTQAMKIRFQVDEVAAFRRGLIVKRRVVSVDLDPSKLTQEQRDKIADHLQRKLAVRLEKNERGELVPDGPLKVANPCLEGLLEAIEENRREIQKAEEVSLSA